MFAKYVRNLKRVELTLDDVTQALRIQEVLQPRHLVLQLTHQSVVGIFVYDGVTADLFGTVSIPGDGGGRTRL